jgi:hypothetical protein
MRDQQAKTLGLSVTADLITGSLTQSSQGSYPDPSIEPCDALSATVTRSRSQKTAGRIQRLVTNYVHTQVKKVMGKKETKF